MIDAELYARIRRLFFAEHWKVGTIATELAVHHETVERAIEADRFVRTPRQIRPSLLDPYKAFIGEVLEKHPRLRATRLFDMLRTRGYAGGYSPVMRYVRSVRPASKAEAFLKLTTLPGEQAQVDWGHFGKIQVGAATRALSCFVLVLSWSRAMFARFTLDQTLETFLLGHALAFETLRGVPRRILYDNLKSVVVERVGEHIRFHPHILECAGHYHFAPVPCAPYRGNEKVYASHCSPFVHCAATF
jgi:transposase